MHVTDRKIIQSLRKNARQSITDLAKDTKVSRPTVIKRLNRMIKDKTINIDAGINLTKLGFQVGCIGIEVKSTNEKSKMQKILEKCPRVIMILSPYDKVTFSVYLFGEDMDTLRSTIYSFKEIPNTDIVYVNYSDAPLYPKSFPINIYLERGAVTPCGQKCKECASYQQNLCIGCPAVEEYKGPL